MDVDSPFYYGEIIHLLILLILVYVVSYLRYLYLQKTEVPLKGDVDILNTVE